ncbi:antirestriction protein [Agrobacterium genomosp. 3]|uniref:Antirestriction protein n=2 Tax=Hyphomicrobiales TaxID=356 RepID=A0AA50H6H6_9HYPH|nr:MULTISPECIES: antirestriction protein [Hyphomicrobiales]KRA03864.1 antirestriction protein [Rhizobium sp. Root564]MBX8800202.1 antirestriction protein [Ochrobactrum sp. MR28]MBX8815814.1 antirestriction protein [Ochrobactrum sp. MR31]MCA1865701.1 antirestriction protein [Agrobacterium tomkonis]MCA1876053.1 antirestriction protein [Agrobacterium tumefaciens]PZU79240.1 MAG: antirestriction protein [Rhizobium sp.]
MSLSDTAVRLATLVPERRRQTFLPTMFGTRHLIIAENTLYNLMGWLSPQDYGGGLWDFYEQEGMPLYLVPTSRPRYRIVCETNGYEGEVPAEAAGIIATLFTFSHLSFKYQSDLLVEGYDRLYAYAADHSEASEIFQAID